MAEVSIEIRGMDELYRRLGKDLFDLIEPVIATGAIRVERRMKEYPPARSGQRYRRTGTLGRRWTHRIVRSPSGVTAEIGNNTRYAPWVQSEQMQRGSFRGRWGTDQQALESEAPLLEADAERIVVRALSE